jgi:hypothetical protein
MTQELRELRRARNFAQSLGAASAESNEMLRAKAGVRIGLARVERFGGDHITVINP